MVVPRPDFNQKEIMDDTMNGGSEDTMQGETGSSTDTPGQGDNTDEPVSVFLPKAALGGKTCKPGDKLTLTVADVDSETGDAECTVDYGADDNDGDEGSMESSFDRAMPPDKTA